MFVLHGVYRVHHGITVSKRCMLSCAPHRLTLTFQGAAASDRGVFYLPCIQGKDRKSCVQGYSVVERSET